MPEEQLEISPLEEGQTPNVCNVPPLSRLACTFCRVRKLRCDKNIPTCGSCARYRHQCLYETTRRTGVNRSRKRGYVSALQERLAQIETSLQKQEARDHNELVQASPGTWRSMGSDSEPDTIPQEVIQELEGVYFQKIHESMPMIHQARYLAATKLELGLQPPIYLRHAILALGACASTQYTHLQERFYRSSREALEFVELNDLHLDMVSVEQAQTWILIATYEFRRMHFHRSWMSTGRAVRLVQMMGLHCMDQNDSAILKGILPKPKDWTEGEERRRTFWMAFCMDRYAGVGHGWPLAIDDKDILTRLPAPDEAFQSCTEIGSLFLPEGMTPTGSDSLSSFAGLIAITALCGQRLTDLRRCDTLSEDDESSRYWRKYGRLHDSMLISTFSVPDHLKIPSMKWDPNLMFLNMVAHTATIRQHQERLVRMGNETLSPEAMRESELERLEAGMSIASIMQANCHVDLAAINPFTSFCLYVAATALAETKTIKLDEHQKNSLQFLLTAMNYLETVNPLTAAFLKDFEDQFPNLTKSFEGLGVETSADDRPIIEEPLSEEMRLHPDPPQGRTRSSTANTASTIASEPPSPFTTATNGPSQEFIDPQALLQDIRNSDYQALAAAMDEQDAFFNGMFLQPRLN